MPKTVLVEAILDFDEPLKPGKKGDHKRLVAAFRDEGECLAVLCSDCEEHIMFEPDDLEYTKVEDTEIEITKISD